MELLFSWIICFHFAPFCVLFSNRWGFTLLHLGVIAGVQEIRATTLAFCALLADGSAVTWGDPQVGGDCSTSVRDDEIEVNQKLKMTNGRCG